MIRFVGVPSKTFLIGEYLALLGGPALVFASEPRYWIADRQPTGTQLVELGRQMGTAGVALPVASFVETVWPEGSPAASAHRRFSPEGWAPESFWIHDPHGKAGGFGRSTAEFLATLGLIPDQDFLPVFGRDGSTPSDSSVRRLIEIYQSTVKQGKPSGADLAGQIGGRFSWWDPARGLETGDWPWSALAELLVVRLGQKVPTHEHLAWLESDAGRAVLASARDELLGVAQRARQAWLEKNLTEFGRALNSAGEVLAERGWQSEKTMSFRDRWAGVRGVLAVKGCGAMGADTALVLVARESAGAVRDALVADGWPVAADQRDLAPGAGAYLL